MYLAASASSSASGSRLAGSTCDLTVGGASLQTPGTLFQDSPPLPITFGTFLRDFKVQRGMRIKKSPSSQQHMDSWHQPGMNIVPVLAAPILIVEVVSALIIFSPSSRQPQICTQPRLKAAMYPSQPHSHADPMQPCQSIMLPELPCN